MITTIDASCKRVRKNNQDHGMPEIEIFKAGTHRTNTGQAITFSAEDIAGIASA